MENESFLSYPTKVRTRMATFFAKKNPFKSSKYRGIIMGVDLSIMISQVMVFLLLQQSTKKGDLPFYVTDLLIVLIAAAVVIVAPFVSWIGSMNRRKTMLICSIITTLCILAFLFIPTTPIVGSEFCSLSGGTAVERTPTGAKAARFGLLASIGFIITITGVAFWNQGVAYIYENNPKVNVHLGILIAVKFVALSMTYSMVGGFTLSSMIWVQIILSTLGVVINIPQLLFVPEELEKQPDGEQGLLTSMGRVLSNGLAMTVIITMSIFSSGFWGFSYNSLEILRTSYFYQEPDNFGYGFTRILYWYFTIGIIVYYSMNVSKSAPATFDRLVALKATVKCFVFITIFLIVMGLLSCEKGNVAGLSSTVYSQPSCSSRCGCNNAALELEPVCVLENMTTYLSPCHAGCSGVEDISGISVLANCTCGVTQQRAVPGACNAYNCDLTASLHHILTASINIFGVVVFQKHLNLILDAVDVKDKGVALGVATSFLFVFTFVAGHIGYFLIGEYTCLWSVNGICQLHRTNFPLIVSMTSVSLIVTAAVITIATIVMQKKRVSAN